MFVPASPRRKLSTLIISLCVALGVSVAAQPASAATSTETTIANAVFTQLNTQRQVNHLPALRSNAALVRSARAHNLTMSRYNSLSHQLPGEAYFSTRIARAGYHWYTCAENIAWTSTASVRGAQVQEYQMYAEHAPDNAHRLNILSKVFRDVGIDIYIDARGGLWLTEDFGLQG